MKRRFTLICTLTVFIVFNLCCVSYKLSHENIETVLSWKDKKIRQAEILEVNKKSGEKIEFSLEEPGRIEADSIKGKTAADSVSILLTNVESVWVRVKNFSLGKTVYKTLMGIGFVILTALAVGAITEI